MAFCITALCQFNKPFNEKAHVASNPGLTGESKAGAAQRSFRLGDQAGGGDKSLRT